MPLIKKEENYGDRLAAIGELKIWYEDGSVEIIPTDTTWKARKNQVCYSGIYPGEIYDTTLDTSEVFDTETIDLGKERLCPRLNPPITIHEHIRPIEVIHTPAGEIVLDMGQNMVGWLSFKSSLPAGSRLYLQFGEVLQNGNFYNDNLRTAKAEFTYISDGQEREVRQHFTFYGFRFVKVEGWQGEIDPDGITEADFDWAVQIASKKKKIDCSCAEFLTINEGLCVQIMHIGPYDNEPASVALMDKFLAENGYENDMTASRLHHEIYLSDARKVAPENWKTVIRHPIKKM